MSVNPRKRPLDNESEDFIRLSPTSTANPVQSNQNYRSNKNWKNRRPKTPSVYGDNNLYSRVQQLLSTTQVMEEHSIVDHLQKKYPEYKRKKKSALKRSVSKTLELMNENLSSEDISEDSSEVIIDPKVQEDTNYLNNVMNDFYSKKDKPNKEVNDSNLSNQRPKQKKNEQKSENDANRKADRNIDALLSKQISLKEKYLCEPKLTFEDFGGISNVIEDIKKLMFHLRHPVLYTTIGVDPPRGFLLHGPPGVGKSAIVEAIAHDLNIPLLRCGATELVAGISGESEGKIRELFNLAKSVKPCILFIDEIDSITQKRENAAKEMERRIVTQLLTSLDNLGSSDSDGVMVIGATNRPDSIDAALRRAGRFDREISLGIPDRKARIDILKILCKNVKLTDNFDFEALGHKTPGYVGADLKSLIREAAITALERVLSIQKIDINSSFDSKNIKIEELTASLTIEMRDFDQAVKQIQPSSKREGFATVPDVTWDDIGALSDIRQELQLSILAPVKYVKDVKTLGLSTSVGIMLCGPPGCGKTLLAKAIANESGINFISVKGPELLNMYVGESERAIRCVFNRARNSQPCVIFFDEMDALCPKRNDSEANYSSRVVNQLLTEMDGLESRNCFLLAATNRPDIIDPAILRPGRFDKILCVSFPAKSDRFEILKTLSKNGTKPPLSPDIDLKCLAEDERLEGMTGADLHSLLRESSLAALKDRITGELKSEDPIIVNKTHMEYALNKIKPSISEEQRRLYQKMYSNYRIKL